MSGARRIGLFQAYGVELEYMIVRRDDLSVLPVADEALKAVAGSYVAEADRGALQWSNELALHLIELKTNGPAASLSGLDALFHSDIATLNTLLAPLGGRLMPTAAHPWMDPHAEMKLWPHESSPIYEAFHRIFNCRGHGWANLQSCHLNLPFASEEEFGRLHAAIRLVLPLLPALAASSPILDGQPTGLVDARLREYRNNCRIIPSVTGDVIPEPVFSPAEYEERILQPMYRDISRLDPEGTLQEEWLNARGAIARFDRNTIEIRLLDVQECPLADMAVLALVTRTLRALTEERWMRSAAQKEFETGRLSAILETAVAEGGDTMISDTRYLSAFGLPGTPCRAADVWTHAMKHVAGDMPAEHTGALARILSSGTLAQRILRSLNGDFSRPALHAAYARLCDCLAANRLFE